MTPFFWKSVMGHGNPIWLCLLLVMLVTAASSALAQDTDITAFEQTVADLGAKSRSTVRKAVEALGASDDPRALVILEALQDRQVVKDETGRILIREGDDMLRDPLTQETLSSADLDLDKPRLNNATRRALRSAMARLQLFAENPLQRLRAANALANRPSDEAEPALRQALAQESDERVQAALELALAQLDLESTDQARRLAAVERLGDTGNRRFRPLLQGLLEKDSEGNYLEQDDIVRRAAQRAVSAIEMKESLVRQAGNLFYGLSLGSVLLLAALGLAVTFGLMGVINMAHGEMLMLGAYATFVVQNLFRTYLPGFFDAYLIAAIPVAFLVSGAIGIILERLVIRHLYGRPLETLLATWGLSLILIQTIRLLFGAQNVGVANPSWLSGGFVVTPGLVLTYNRIATIVFAGIVLSAVWLLFQRTRLGLNVRAVTQNRPMAAAMGINTSQVDMWTFGLGSGVAGLGGVALSQLGNVGPELGQAYIVDSFMVVVLGGVGKLAGAVAGAFSLGLLNKFLEPTTGAVLGKIMVLVFLILFIQKRPQGIFALKGRAAEA
jgi:urea transport system permease protein